MDTSHCASPVHSGGNLQGLRGSHQSPSGSAVRSRCLKWGEGRALRTSPGVATFLVVLARFPPPAP